MIPAQTRSQPAFMESPLTLVPDIQRETVFINRQMILLERPAQSDRLLDDPIVQCANEVDDYMPYWADIWPASQMMAKVVLRMIPRDALPQAGRSGTGLRSGACRYRRSQERLLCHLQRLRSDRPGISARNARLNGFSDFQTLPLDWRCPPQNLRVSLLLAADLTYEMRNIDPLLALIPQLLEPGGLCLLTDPDRTPAPHLRRRLQEEKLPYTSEFIRAGEPGGNRVKGTLYRIRLPEKVNLCENSNRSVPSE